MFLLQVTTVFSLMIIETLHLSIEQKSTIQWQQYPLSSIIFCPKNVLWKGRLDPKPINFVTMQNINLQSLPRKQK